MLRRIAALLLGLVLLLPLSAAGMANCRYAGLPPADWAERAEQAALLGLSDPGGAPDRTWFAAALEAAFGRQLSVTPGVLTRGGAAALLTEALGYGGLAAREGEDTGAHPDLTGPAALCLRLGLLDPPADGELFFPDAPIPWEQAAAALARTYERWSAPVSWLHGFYAFSSYSQIGLAAEMDAVSVGWALLDVDGETGPFLNQTSAGGNSWAIPADPSPAIGFFTENNIPYHLNVYAGATPLTLADGTVTNDLYGILSTPEARAQAIALLAEVSGDYAGITIDIEGLRTPLREAFSRFMADLRAALPADKGLYVCVPPPDWYGGYDYRALGEVCDKVILMAHDYQWPSVPADYVGGTNTDTPVTPFNYVYSALLALTDPETGVRDRSKLALQISIASCGLKVDEDGVLLSRTLYSPGPGTVIKRLRQPDTVRRWSDYYKNASILYTSEDGSRFCLWYEDARSAEEKLRLAHLLGVDGLSLWRLGTIPNYSDPDLDYDVWTAVTRGR